jgi:hypothetical protein
MAAPHRSLPPVKCPIGPRATRAAFTVLEASIAGAIVTVLLSGLFVLQSNMMRMLDASTQTTNASAHLQTRVEQVRLANWSQVTDPDWVQSSLLNTPADADVNLPGCSETYTVSPYQSPCSAAPAATPPPPFTVTRQADGTLKLSPAGYSYSTALAGQEMIQVDLSVTWPSLGRSRTRAQSTLVSPWGISK